MPLDELVKFWKGKEVQSEVDITEHIEVMRANMELSETLPSKIKREKRELRNIIMKEKWSRENLK